MENCTGVACRGIHKSIADEPAIGFYEYYQISFESDDDDDEQEEFGSGRERGVKGHMEGLHSPWGLIGQIKAERGCTHDYLLWNEAWINILMERADAPRYSKKQKVPVVNGAEGLKNILGDGRGTGKH